jgi:putative transposase
LGTERIHGELLKLNLKAATTTIQKYIRLARPHRTLSQTWSILLNNHAKDVWACDFLPVINLFFRQMHPFFNVELASRRIIYFNVTDRPTDSWVTEQLREATPFGQAPRFLIRDRDRRYGQTFTRVPREAKSRF